MHPSEWSDTQWDNLQHLQKHLGELLNDRKVNNAAWVLKLKLTIESIAGYSTIDVDHMKQMYGE